MNTVTAGLFIFLPRGTLSTYLKLYFGDMYNFLGVSFGVEMLFASPPVDPSTAVYIFVAHGGLIITCHLLAQL